MVTISEIWESKVAWDMVVMMLETILATLLRCHIEIGRPFMLSQGDIASVILTAARTAQSGRGGI